MEEHVGPIDVAGIVPEEGPGVIGVLGGERMLANFACRIASASRLSSSRARYKLATSHGGPCYFEKTRARALLAPMQRQA